MSMRSHIIVSGDDALATTIVEELNNAGVHIVKLAGAAELARVERRHERRLVDQRTARRVDQQRAGLHPGEACRVDHATGLGHERAMQADDVRRGIERVERRERLRHLQRVPVRGHEHVRHEPRARGRRR